MTETYIDIEKVDLTSLKKLQLIGRQTFFDTFSNGSSNEDMNKYLENKFSIEQLTKELKNSNSKFFFAKKENEIIGYLKLNFDNAQTEINNQEGVEIERIYVLKKYHGKKIGQYLYDLALGIAKEKEANYIWLGVWEKNLRAIRFYEKNGFVKFDKHIFVLGDDQQTDVMMKLELKNNS